MPDRDLSLTEHPNRELVSSRSRSFSHSLRYWIGLIFMIIGDALVIASLFSPWVEIYKTDPTYFIPRQGYSPLTVLQRGQVDNLGVASGMLFLVALGLLTATISLARARSANTRSNVGFAVVLLTLAVLILVWIMLTGLPFALSFGYPYYEYNLLYGGNLAIIGLLSALVGAVLLAGWWQRGAHS